MARRIELHTADIVDLDRWRRQRSEIRQPARRLYPEHFIIAAIVVAAYAMAAIALL